MREKEWATMSNSEDHLRWDYNRCFKVYQRSNFKLFGGGRYQSEGWRLNGNQGSRSSKYVQLSQKFWLWGHNIESDCDLVSFNKQKVKVPKIETSTG